MNEYRVLVCGGRGFVNWIQLYNVLDALRPAPTEIIHGGSMGADQIAGRWARQESVRERVFWADWRKLGKAAGPIRNQKMLDESKPHLVVAFPGGPGTADMVKRARAAGVEVREIPKEQGSAKSP